ncbi:MAG: hypothetical protein HY683_08610 [Chloroflexi bacterium]|nr:hypothetical protein [Chloroflexota bacterium]
MLKTKGYLMLGLFSLLAVALAAAACSGGVSKSDIVALQAGVQSKADAAAITAFHNGVTQNQADLKKDVLALQEQVKSGPDLAAVGTLLNAKFTTFEKGVPLWDIQPGTAPRMRELTESFNLMWFAAQAGNWEFAGFEVYRAGEEVKGVLVTRPGRKEAITEWSVPNLKALEEAVKAKDKAVFEKAYDSAVEGCNTCHTKSKGGGFEMGAIKVTRPAAPLFPNLDYKGQ